MAGFIADLLSGVNRVVSGLLSSYNGVATTNAGVAAIYFNSDLTGQTGAISAQSLIASTPFAGMWRINWYAVITAETGNVVLGGATGFQVTYTDVNTASSATTPEAGAPSNNVNQAYSQTNSGNGVGDSVSGCTLINATSGSAVTYSFGFTGTITYAIHVRAEYLG